MKHGVGILDNPGANQTQWCAEHWAPYARGEANGIFASLALMQEFLDSPIYGELTDKSAASLNRVMFDGDKRLCCRLGETVMARIFDQARAGKKE